MEDLIISLKNGVRTIKFNRPKRKNAITHSMYIKVTNILNEDANNDDVVVTVFTGTGDYYSSGNDFKDVMERSLSSDTPVSSMGHILELVDAFITYPKLLVAVVNGPAIGIAATTIGLCDIVYATENAWFQTPFMQLSLCPEGCSSYTFPRILGRSMASEMLFLNKKLTAQEAYTRGLVSRVVPFSSVNSLIEEINQLGQLPVSSVKITKSLMNNNLKKILRECNKNEVEALVEVTSSDQFINAVMKVMNRKSKL